MKTTAAFDVLPSLRKHTRVKHRAPWLPYSAVHIIVSMSPVLSYAKAEQFRIGMDNIHKSGILRVDPSGSYEGWLISQPCGVQSLEKRKKYITFNTETYTSSSTHCVSSF